MNRILSHEELYIRISEIFSLARSFKESSQWVSKQMQSIYTEVASKTAAGRPRYTSSTRGFVSGVYQALSRSLYVHDLEFCYKDHDGTLYSTHKSSSHRLTEEFFAVGKGHMLGDMEGHHYWKDSGKIFF